MTQVLEKPFGQSPVAKIKCTHCGDACEESDLDALGNSFCCEGCRMVYSILNQNGLNCYYELNEDAGISQKNQLKRSYGFLDDPVTVERLIDFKDNEKTKVHFYLPQIHCSSCLWLLENLHKINDQIIQSRVNFPKKEVQLFYSHETTLKEVVELLARIGYAPVIQLENLDAVKNDYNNSLYYKLGLSGFVFGNIMLLSFPEYLGIDSSNDALVSFFGYLNIFLILPVIFYSGRDYLVSAFHSIRQKHLNIDVPVALGILALFFRSCFEILNHSGAGYLDSLAGLIFFLLIGKWFQQKTYSRISFERDYKSYFPIACIKKEGNKEIQITLDKLTKGDTILIRSMELIPADGILMKGVAEIDYSFVNGESAPSIKNIGDKLYAGGRQTGGIIEVGVTKPVTNSYLVQLWNNEAFVKPLNTGNVSKIADRVAAFFTWTILSIASLTLIYWLPYDIGYAINAFTAVLIIACPCAVALSIPFTFGNVVRILSQSQIFCRNSQVIEDLASVETIVFDKTGTITDTTQSKLVYEGDALSKEEQRWVGTLAKNSSHPASRLIYSYFGVNEDTEVNYFKEILNQGIAGEIDGNQIRIGSRSFIAVEDKKYGNENLFISINRKFRGSIKKQTKYRDNLKGVLDALSKWSNLSLISGDNDLEEQILSTYFKNNLALHFNAKPQEKLEYIKQLQSKGQSVCMIGDGLNDAGALKQSDVGISITEDTSSFTPACDLIMLSTNFSKIPNIFKLARTSIKLIYIAYGIALIYNIVGLFFAVQGQLSPLIAAILMPLSSISIVVFGVVASTLIAHKYGFKKEMI